MHMDADAVTMPQFMTGIETFKSCVAVIMHCRHHALLSSCIAVIVHCWHDPGVNDRRTQS